MKKFFYSHPDVVIVSLAIVFLAILIGFYSWAINDAFFELHTALGSSQSEIQTTFNLNGASTLDFRGLLSATATGANP
jgi:hypothetical protein